MAKKKAKKETVIKDIETVIEEKVIKKEESKIKMSPLSYLKARIEKIKKNKK